MGKLSKVTRIWRRLPRSVKRKIKSKGKQAFRRIR